VSWALDDDAKGGSTRQAAEAGPLGAKEARYDGIADWYAGWVGQAPGVICDPEHGLVPFELVGQRWLDVACGQGRTSREPARRGAEAVGVGLSAENIAEPKQLASLRRSAI
jgi:2-polyprenyl-3-methyl-5-hydroxy-6-metoxy-1,4-benzoquinol methylase